MPIEQLCNPPLSDEGALDSNDHRWLAVLDVKAFLPGIQALA